MSNSMNVETYTWRCAALSASATPVFMASTHGVKRASAAAEDAAIRAWNGPIT